MTVATPTMKVAANVSQLFENASQLLSGENKSDATKKTVVVESNDPMTQPISMEEGDEGVDKSQIGDANASELLFAEEDDAGVDKPQIGDANPSELLSTEEGDEGVDKPQIGDANASELLPAEEGDGGVDKSDAFAHTSPFTTEGPVEFINRGGRPCPVLLGE